MVERANWPNVDCSVHSDGVFWSGDGCSASCAGGKFVSWAWSEVMTATKENNWGVTGEEKTRNGLCSTKMSQNGYERKRSP